MDMGQEPVKRGRAYRGALAAVILLSILLAVGLVLLVIGFMRQYRIYAAHRAADEAPAVVHLAPGAHIASVQSGSGKLVLHVATPKGREVEVIDLATGKLISRTQEKAK